MPPAKKKLIYNYPISKGGVFKETVVNGDVLAWGRFMRGMGPFM